MASHSLDSVLHLAFPNYTKKYLSFLAQLVLFHCVHGCYNTTRGTAVQTTPVGGGRAISG